MTKKIVTKKQADEATKTTAKAEAAKDPFSLQGVPGFGPAVIKCLQEEGLTTTLHVIHKNPVWLKDVTGMDKDKAGEAFAYMKKRLIEAKVLSPMDMTATQLLEERKKIQRISLDCKSVDHLLKGGIECGSVTELYGENGAGKTQFSHTLSVQVQRPVEDGGLRKDGEAPPMVAYIDTENTFRIERIHSILRGKGLISDYPSGLKTKIIEGKILNPEEIKQKEDCEAVFLKEAEKYTDNILVYRVSDAIQQCDKIRSLIPMSKHVPIKLIIIDSGTALFRGEYIGRGNLKSKFDYMNEMVHDLKSIAELNKIAILFVNQIYNKPEEGYGADPDIPYGGNIIGHAMPYRLKVEKSGSKRRLKIMKSPYQANDDVRFDIAESGLVEIE